MKKTINFLIVLMLLIEASFASQIAPSIGDSEVLSSEELNLPIIYQDFGNNLYVSSASGYGESLRLELSDGTSIRFDTLSKTNRTGIITTNEGKQINFSCNTTGQSIETSNHSCQFFQDGQGMITNNPVLIGVGIAVGAFLFEYVIEKLVLDPLWDRFIGK